MRMWLGHLLRGIAGVIDPPPLRAEQRKMTCVTRWSDEEDSRRIRNEAALNILEDDTLGFVSITINDGSVPEVLIAADVPTDYWPAVAVTMRRIVGEVGNVNP
jgi:hypothetical protein